MRYAHTESKHKHHAAAEKPSVQTAFQAYEVLQKYVYKYFLQQLLCQVFDKNKEPIVLYVHAASVAMGCLLSTKNIEIMKYLYFFCLALTWR